MGLDIHMYLDIDTGGAELYRVDLFDTNYTHNCNTMAEEAGIYEYVWHPERRDVKTAGDLIEPLASGIRKMELEPERFIKLNPDNGWGSYETFLPWLKEYLEACIQHPNALVVTWT